MAKNWTAKELELRITGLVLPFGLELDEVLLHGCEVEVGSEPFSAVAHGKSPASVRVSAEAIERLLQGLLLSSISDITVSTEGDKLKVAAVVRVIVPIPAVALCALVLDEGKRVRIALESVEPAGGRAIVERQLNQINPIVDLTSLPVDLTIERVQVADGWVTLTGHVG